MNWDEVSTQVLRDLWTVRFGETWAWCETHVTDEWNDPYTRLAAALQFEWEDAENYVARLVKAPHDT